MTEGNICWCRSLEFMERYNARDWDWIESFYAEDVVFEDRRPGLSSVVAGRPQQLEHMKVIADIGSIQSRMSKVAERGDWLALVKVEWETPVPDSDPYEIEMLMVAELDESERCIGLAIFDAEDLDGARLELEARFAARKGTTANTR